MSLLDLIRRWFRPAPPPPPANGPWRRQLLDLINAARGLNRPLITAADLNAAAQDHAARMASRDALYHPPGVVEVIAAGRQTPAEVVGDWLDSPGHRRLLLGPYSTIGFGRAESRGGTVYWTARLS